MPMDEKLENEVRAKKREKIHFLYEELCDAFFWKEDTVSSQILVHLADGSDLESIKEVLIGDKGIYDHNTPGILPKLEYIEKLIEA